MIVRPLCYTYYLLCFWNLTKRSDKALGRLGNGCGKVGQTGEGRVDVNIKGFETKRNISFASLA